jgi:hypothetical protein
VSLQAVLAELYTDRQSAERIARAAGVDPAHVAWSPRMDDTWHSLVEEARRQSRLYDLVAVVLREYPLHEPLRLAAEEAVPGAIVTHNELPMEVGRLKHRVDTHETLLRRIMAELDPGPRKRTARTIFYAVLIALWSSWMVAPIREWYLANPIQAAVISAAAIIVAFVVRWLPEADDEKP